MLLPSSIEKESQYLNNYNSSNSNSNPNSNPIINEIISIQNNNNNINSSPTTTTPSTPTFSDQNPQNKISSEQQETNSEKKRDLEIYIDEEDAIENFGEEIFQENISHFIESGYKHTFEGIKEAEYHKDHSKMKLLTHTLKTTARYMSSENFAQICQKIENETKVPNWEKIFYFLEDFYFYLEILYKKTLAIYNKFKGKEINDEGPRENLLENMEFYEREKLAKLEKIGKNKIEKNEREREKSEREKLIFEMEKFSSNGNNSSDKKLFKVNISDFINLSNFNSSKNENDDKEIIEKEIYSKLNSTINSPSFDVRRN